jgi:hypothetical protein
MRKHYIIILFVLLVTTANSQQKETDKAQINSPLKLRKNGAYVNLSYAATLGQAGLTYERQIAELRNSYVYARAGFGFGYNWSDTYSSYRMDFAYILFKKKSHLEFNIGVNYVADCYEHGTYFCIDAGDIFPILNIAYRYQKPGGRFIFRVAVGSESYYNLSFGLAI